MEIVPPTFKTNADIISHKFLSSICRDNFKYTWLYFAFQTVIAENISHCQIRHDEGM